MLPADPPRRDPPLEVARGGEGQAAEHGGRRPQLARDQAASDRPEQDPADVAALGGQRLGRPDQAGDGDLGQASA
jgi:hypothetical protein